MLKPQVNYHYDLSTLHTFIEQDDGYSCTIYFVDKSDKLSREVFAYYEK